jgi:hypothetical protein
MKKMKKKNVNLILSHVNLTFLPIGPYLPLNTLILLFFIKTINVKKGPIQEFNLFQFVSNWSLRFWILDHHLKQL